MRRKPRSFATRGKERWMATKKTGGKSSGKTTVEHPVEHIEEAKRPETRERRIERSIALLAAGKKEPR